MNNFDRARNRVAKMAPEGRIIHHPQVQPWAQCKDTGPGGMLPPCTLIDGHEGRHADGFGGSWSRADMTPTPKATTGGADPYLANAVTLVPEMVEALHRAGVALRFYGAWMKANPAKQDEHDTSYPFGQDVERRVMAVLLKAESY